VIVLVVGDRNTTAAAIFDELDRIHQEHTVTLLIQNGGHGGIDQLARDWCFFNDVTCRSFIPQCRVRERPATSIERHRPDLVIAFPGGKETADMIRQAKAAGLAIWCPGNAVG
jgi:hypothetical protein